MKTVLLLAVCCSSFLFTSCVTDDDPADGPRSSISTQPWGGPIPGEGGAAFGGAIQSR